MERRARAIEENDRLRARIWRRGLIAIMAVSWTGVALVLWSFHTTSPTAGTLAFYGGLAVGDVGFLAVFVRTWRKVERISPS